MRAVAVLGVVTSASQLVTATGCGRLAFEPHSSPDAVAALCRDVPTGHDEDADGIDDGCDVCPVITNVAQADRDGDRVGDPCDPEPDNPRQQIVLFDPFATLDAMAWEFTGGERAENDELVFEAADSTRSIRRPYSLGED